MNRLTKSKLSLLGNVLIIALYFFLIQTIGNILIVVALLIATMVGLNAFTGKQRREMTNFNTGKKLLNKGQNEDSIHYFEKFIKDMNKNPKLKKTTFLNFGYYTKSYEAMTYNNLGTAHINLEKFKIAEKHLKKAIEIDDEYGIPYVNLTVLETSRGKIDLASEYASRARELGLKVRLGLKN